MCKLSFFILSTPGRYMYSDLALTGFFVYLLFFELGSNLMEEMRCLLLR